MLQRLGAKGLTGNQLKIIALIAMTLDHAGKLLWPGCVWMQVVGRLAFPIFAYMVAEGCTYTKNRKKYLGMMAGLAFVCQLVYLVAMGSLYQSVLVSFTLSILIIYIVDWAKGTGTIWLALALAVVSLGLAWFLSVELPIVLWRTDYNIDYGFAGILLVVGIYYAKGCVAKLAMATVMLAVLGIAFEGIQWYGLFALPLLALYGGERGKHKLKYLFYIYYPAHLVGICLIGLLMQKV